MISVKSFLFLFLISATWGNELRSQKIFQNYKKTSCHFSVSDSESLGGVKLNSAKEGLDYITLKNGVFQFEFGNSNRLKIISPRGNVQKEHLNYVFPRGSVGFQKIRLMRGVQRFHPVLFEHLLIHLTMAGRVPGNGTELRTKYENSEHRIRLSRDRVENKNRPFLEVTKLIHRKYRSGTIVGKLDPHSAYEKAVHETHRKYWKKSYRDLFFRMRTTAEEHFERVGENAYISGLIRMLRWYQYTEGERGSEYLAAEKGSNPRMLHKYLFGTVESPDIGKFWTEKFVSSCFTEHSCALEKKSLDQIISLGFYENTNHKGQFSKAILDFKDSKPGSLESVLKLKNREYKQFINSSKGKYDLVIPIPSSSGSDAVNALAEKIAKDLGRGVKAENNLLIKRTMVRQKKLSRFNRFLNALNSLGFSQDDRDLWKNQVLTGKRILLVDDVMTSGATVFVAMERMFYYTPERIQVFVLGKVK